MFQNNPTLAMIWKDTCRDSVEFPPFMANHLPMILIALERMGATEEQFCTYPSRYRLVTPLVTIDLPSEGRINRDNWNLHLGDRDYELDYRAFFITVTHDLGIEGALATYLDELLPGIAGSAMHALMRLAFAKLSDNVDEVGVALGYWAMAYLTLADLSGPGNTEDPIEILLRLHDMPDLKETKSTPNDLLWEWMVEAASKPSFSKVGGWLTVTDTTMNRLRQTAAALMATTMTFEALHAVTALHWLRILNLDPKANAIAMRGYWTAVASVYHKIDMPMPLSGEKIEEMRTSNCPEWKEIRAKACASDDEHDISFVFSSGEEFTFTGDRIYQVLAAKRMGLIN
jgi:hypothetical protein